MNRKDFLKQLGLASAATLIHYPVLSEGNKKASDTLKFGIITDVHKDIMPDADDRLIKFIDKAKEKQVDFIIQMGDFCEVLKTNKEFISIWQSCKINKYNVLGNHDMDRQSKRSVMDFWEMEKPYYSYDFKGYHFIVLDANFMYKDNKFIHYDTANFYVKDEYRTFINDEQIEWFKADLTQTKLPTIVFSHQSLWHYNWGVKNRLVLQNIMENQGDKVICCFNGHNHIDYHRYMNGIHYIDINSASYKWMRDEKYSSKERFKTEDYKKSKWLHRTAGYRESLFAFVSLNPNGTLLLEGTDGKWMDPSPYDMGMPKGIEGEIASPKISDYNLKFKT